MTNPVTSDETIAAALALPLKARIALAQVLCPGWYCLNDGCGSPVGRPRFRETPRIPPTNRGEHVGAWIPASEAVIMQVWDSMCEEPRGWYVGDQECALETEAGVCENHAVAEGNAYDKRLRSALLCCPLSCG